MSEESWWTTHSFPPGLLIENAVLFIWLSLSSVCHCHAVTCGRQTGHLHYHHLVTALLEWNKDMCRAIKHWILLALFLSPPETLPAFFSFPCSQAQLTKTSGINTFQNTLQENKYSKIKKNNAKLQHWAVGLTQGQWLWAGALGRSPNALSWQYSPCCPSHLPGTNSSSRNVEGVSDHFSVFTFSRTH